MKSRGLRPFLARLPYGVHSRVILDDRKQLLEADIVDGFGDVAELLNQPVFPMFIYSNSGVRLPVILVEIEGWHSGVFFQVPRLLFTERLFPTQKSG